MIYNLLCLWAVVLPKIYRNKNLYFVCVYGLMAILAGFRDVSVGTDTLSYASIYYMYRYLSLDEIIQSNGIGIERGVLLIIKLSYIVYDSPVSFNFFMAFFTCIFIGYFVYYNVKQYELATFIIIALGFFFYMMNVERQALSIAICANSYPYIIRGEKLRPIIILSIAAFFHYSILIMIPMMILYLGVYKMNLAYKRNYKRLIFISVASVFALYFGFDYLININNLELLSNAYGVYLSPENKFNASVGAKGYLIIQMGVLVFVAIFINSFRLNYENSCENFFIGQMLMVASVMLVAEMKIMFIFYRFVDTFSFPLCMGVPKFLNLITSGREKNIIKYFIYIMGWIFMNLMMSAGIQGIYPYNFGL